MSSSAGRVALIALVACSCAGSVNRFVVDDVVTKALGDADTGKACAMGASLVHPISAVNGDAHLALAIAEGVSAVCDQTVAWEAELKAARTKPNGRALGDARAAEIIDAQLVARRANARTAARFNRSFEQGQLAFGSIGQGCPAFSNATDRVVFVFVLVTGTLALLHDTASGGAAHVPTERLNAVARASTCLDDASWWHVPMALRGAAMAMVPGNGPDGWATLERASTLGAPSGVRVAVAIEALVANNAGKSEQLARALSLHAQSLAKTPGDPRWLLFDTYAREISLHQSDLVWSEAAGHRTEQFGVLPAPPTGSPPAADEVDPFAPP